MSICELIYTSFTGMPKRPQSGYFYLGKSSTNAYYILLAPIGNYIIYASSKINIFGGGDGNARKQMYKIRNICSFTVSHSKIVEYFSVFHPFFWYEIKQNSFHWSHCCPAS